MNIKDKPKKKKKKKVKKVNKAKLIKKLKKQNFELWSQCVRLRDKKCIVCGSTETLQAHHCLVRAALSLRTRFIPENGVTLCYRCHLIEIHKNGEKRFMENYIRILDEKIPKEKQEEIYKLAENKDDITLEDLQNINIYLKEYLQKLKNSEQNIVNNQVS